MSSWLVCKGSVTLIYIYEKQNKVFTFLTLLCILVLREVSAQLCVVCQCTSVKNVED